MFETLYAESQTFRDNIHLLRRLSLRTFLHHLIDEDHSTTQKETVKLMARIYATDDQAITEVYFQADSDQVPVDGTTSPVTVAVVDPAGADVSKWVNIAQDSANPLKFVFTRKPDDGTQPQVLDFTSIGTGTVNGAPAEFKSDLGFTPGAATSLTSTVSVGAPAAASTSATATEPPAGTATEPPAGTATEPPAGTATEPPAGTAA